MNNSVMFWIILAVVLAVIEGATFSLVSIWGAVAAALCAVLAAFSLSEAALPYIFVITTFILVLLTRPIAKKLMKDKPAATNADRAIGAEGKVVKTIEKFSPGEVLVFGQRWTAEAKDGEKIEEGKTVTVSEIRGVRLIVKEN